MSERGLIVDAGANPPCMRCGGPHAFDTSIPSVVWNAVIRAAGLDDYLCLCCIVREFVLRDQSFTAELFGDGLHGPSIEVVVRGQRARDAAKIGEENTSLRHKIRMLESELEARDDAK